MLLLVAGIVVFAVSDLGWQGQHALGASLAVTGLLVLMGLGGWLLDRRSSPRETRATT